MHPAHPPYPTCTARRKDGQPCRGPRIKGSDKCRMHAGGRQARANAKVRAELLAWRLDDATADPNQVLLRLLSQSAARCERYSHLLGEMFTAAGQVKPGPAIGTDLAGEVLALIGHTYGAAGKDGVIYETGEAVRGMVVLEGQERDRCARFAKLAIDAGIADRLVRLEEGKAAMVVVALRAGLLAAGVPHNDPRVGKAISATLRQLEGSPA